MGNVNLNRTNVVKKNLLMHLVVEYVKFGKRQYSRKGALRMLVVSAVISSIALVISLTALVLTIKDYRTE
jgi:hypothetical protein